MSSDGESVFLTQSTYKQSTDEILLNGVIDIEIEREKCTQNRSVFDINEDLFFRFI